MSGTYEMVSVPQYVLDTLRKQNTVLIKQRDTLIKAIEKARILIDMPAGYLDILKAHGILSDALELARGE